MCRRDLDPGAHTANEKYLRCAGKYQQRAEGLRKRDNSPRFDDCFSGGNLNFFFMGGHAHLRMDECGDSRGNQQNAHNRDGMKSHVHISAPDLMYRLLLGQKRVRDLTKIVRAAGITHDMRKPQAVVIIHRHAIELRPIGDQQLNGR
jgi:hypothetical protein